MLNENQKNGIRSLFRMIDVNKDGTIDNEDLTTFSERISNLRLSLMKEMTFTAKFVDRWYRTFNVVDANDDYKITEDEFINFVAQAAENRENLRSSLSSLVQSLFDMLDSNTDGTIGKTEFVKMLGGEQEETRRDAERFYDAIDKRQSLSVGVSDLMDAIEAFICNDGTSQSS